jgi:hypothetical protein
VTAEEIDRINILQAALLAMRRALDGLSVRPEHIIVDGNKWKPYGFPAIPADTVVKGDGKYLSIAAASVLAKTYRDDYMNRLHEMYASLKMPSGLSAAETPKDAAEKQQDNADAEKNPAEAEKNDANAAENAEDAAEKQRDDVSDINDGNMETGSEPEKTEETSKPVEDKVNANELFMKLLKGEM